MPLGIILMIIVMLMLVSVLPHWPHSRAWGYGPSGGLGLAFYILATLYLVEIS